MKLIKLIDESLKSLFGVNMKKEETALQIVQEETKNKKL